MAGATDVQEGEHMPREERQTVLRPHGMYQRYVSHRFEHSRTEPSGIEPSRTEPNQTRRLVP